MSHQTGVSRYHDENRHHVHRLVPQHDHELAVFLDSVGRSTTGASVLAYHFPFYRDLLLKLFGRGAESASFALRDAKGEIKAVLPGILYRTINNKPSTCREFLNAQPRACYNSLPFFGPNAGVLAYDQPRAVHREIEGSLTRAALDFAAENNCLSAVFYSRFLPADHISSGDMIHAGTNSETLATAQCHYATREVVRLPKTTQYLHLTGNTDLVWPPKIRYDLRKAAQAGVRIIKTLTHEAEIQRFLQIYAENCRNCGAPQKPDAFLRELVAEAVGDATAGDARAGDSGASRGETRRVGVYGAKLGEELIAALIVLWGPQTASYYLPCVSASHRGLQPGTLLIDHACRDAINRGIRFWNFESSPSRESGVFAFKKKWGAVETNYEITVVRLCSHDELQEIGPQRLAASFPHFFVYPYQALKPTVRPSNSFAA